MIKIVDVSSLTPEPIEPGEYTSTEVQGPILLKDTNIDDIKSGVEAFILTKSKTNEPEADVWLAINAGDQKAEA